VGKRRSPDQPTKTKRSLLSQSSSTSNHPLCEIGCESVEEVITSYVFLIFILTLLHKEVNESFYSSPIHYSKSEKEKYKNCEYHKSYSYPDCPVRNRFVVSIMRHKKEGCYTLLIISVIQFYQLIASLNPLGAICSHTS